MTDVIKTYDRVAPMGGLAVMAMRLAEKRAGYRGLTATDEKGNVRMYPVARSWFESSLGCGAECSRTYYLIIDRITRGEKP